MNSNLIFSLILLLSAALWAPHSYSSFPPDFKYDFSCYPPGIGIHGIFYLEGFMWDHSGEIAANSSNSSFEAEKLVMQNTSPGPVMGSFYGSKLSTEESFTPTLYRYVFPRDLVEETYGLINMNIRETNTTRPEYHNECSEGELQAQAGFLPMDRRESYLAGEDLTPMEYRQLQKINFCCQRTDAIVRSLLVE